MPPNLSNRNRIARSVFALPPTLLNALYPPRCAGCDAFCEALFCTPCHATLQIAPPISRIESAREDSTSREYSQIVPGRDAAFRLEARATLLFDGALREAIHHFKYEGRIALAAPLAHLMLETLRAAENATASTRTNYSTGKKSVRAENAASQNRADANPTAPRRARSSASTRAPLLYNASPILVPIPLHAWRKWRRGYNQSELLARELARLINAPCVPLLRRARYTVTQTELSREQRTENVRDAFALNENAARVLAGKNAREIVLVDDVYTTGATLEEAARILRAAFPDAKFSALTLAYQPPS